MIGLMKVKKMSENEINAFQFIVNQLMDIKEDLKSMNKKLDEMNSRWIDEEQDDDTFECQNCHERYSEDEKGSSELALQDGICTYCMEDGYGR